MDVNPHMDDIMLTDFLVSHLVSFRFVDANKDLTSFCHGANFFPSGNQFAVLVLQIERWSSVFLPDDDRQEASKHHFFILQNTLCDLLGQVSQCICGEKDYQMVCIINFQQEWSEMLEILKHQLTKILEVLETEFNISVTVAISEPVPSLNALPSAYSQADTALWYNYFLELDEQILFYEKLYGQDYPIIHSDLSDLDRELIQHLSDKNARSVKYILHKMIDRELIHFRPSIQILRCRVGGVTCKILDALDEFRSIIDDAQYYALNPAPRILEASTLTDMVFSMDEIFDSIAILLDGETREPKPQWVDKMTLYIESHYTTEALGLSEVSAAFDITPSYATRVYKQYTGMGIYEAIQHARLSAAKSLLHTNKTMKEIASEVGYTSFLSMNRAFKKYEGITPSQFKYK